MRNSLAANLHNQGSNQSDASFGLTAGVAEALIQSHAGEICRLPVNWPDGSVTGLRARGGFEVNLTWKDGELLVAEIRSLKASPCTVRYGIKTALVNLEPEVTLRLSPDLTVLN